MSAEKLLSRLEGVKQTGPNRWIARCPAHDDRSPSLSLRDAGGTLLLHCFAGCDPLAVVSAVGLTFEDLFPEPGGYRRPQANVRTPARDLLAIIDHEAIKVYAIACAIVHTKSAGEEDLNELATAVRRIGRARDHAWT